MNESPYPYLTLRMTPQQYHDIMDCAEERGISPLTLVTQALFDDIAR